MFFTNFRDDRFSRRLAIFATVFKCLMLPADDISSVSNLEPESDQFGDARIPFVEIPSARTDPFAISKVIFTGGRFIAVGKSSYSLLPFPNNYSAGPSVIMVSDDGTEWRTIHTNRLGLHSIASDGTRLVVVADGGAIVTSTNGVLWQTITNAAANSLADVAS